MPSVGGGAGGAGGGGAENGRGWNWYGPSGAQYSLMVRCAFFAMDSAALGLGSSGCGCCTVRVFQQKFTLEDVHSLLPVHTANCVQTLKDFGDYSSSTQGVPTLNWQPWWEAETFGPVQR
jgi:hypothetical protein